MNHHDLLGEKMKDKRAFLIIGLGVILIIASLWQDIRNLFIRRSVVELGPLPTVHSVIEDVKTLSDTYPQWIQYGYLGTSPMGRRIPYMTLGTGTKKGLVVAEVHGREHITTTFLLSVVEAYAKSAADNILYGDYNLREFLEIFTITIVPMANPDGLAIVTEGGEPSFMELTEEERSLYKANGEGTDLNRNFPFYWEEINNGIIEPSISGYKGDAPNSAKETELLMALSAQHNYLFMLSLHTKGNVLFATDAISPDVSYTIPLTVALSNVCGFETLPATMDPNGYGGGFENWFRFTYNEPGINIELIDVEEDVDPLAAVSSATFKKLTHYNKTKYFLAVTMEVALLWNK